MARRLRKGRIILVATMVLLSIIALLIVWPYFRAILGALVVSYIFLPLQQLLVRKTKNPSLSAFIVLLVIGLFLIVPLTVSGFLLVREVQLVVTDSNLGINQAISAIGSVHVPATIASVIHQQRLEQYLQNAVVTVSNRIVSDLDRILVNALGLLLQIFVFVFLTYFFLRDYGAMQHTVRRVSRNLLSKSDATLLETYFVRVGSTVNSVVRGTIIVALVQSLLLVPVYYLVGISTPLIWGILTFFIALIPLVGVPGAWVPILAFKVFQALVTNDHALLVRDVIYAAWALLVVSNIDNIIKPAIIGRQARIHPVVVFLGIIGGLPLFGIVGLIVGPVVLTAVLMFYNTFFVERPEEAVPKRQVSRG